MLALRQFVDMTRLPPTTRSARAGARHGLAAAAVSILAQTAGAAGQPDGGPRSPRNASYTLSASLDPGARAIEGAGHIHWRNVTSLPASELRLHLYWNAWRDPASTWLAEHRLGLDPSLPVRPPEDYGWIDISRLERIEGSSAIDLRRNMRYIAPDDGNREDRSLLQVTLDRPVAPDESIELDLAWSARVPRTYARTGHLGSYYLIAHWFPKVGVLADDGWQARQFHAATEFFADFGVYDVTLQVPAGWVVGATGREAARADLGDGTTTHRYIAEDVHDFAWTTSPDFVERRDRFEAPGMPPVDIRLLLQPGHAGQASRYLEAVRTALDRFGRWFGPYAYPQLTVVDPAPVVEPARQGRSTGGMEYPTLITGGTRWSSPARGLQPEAVTIHETAHQFWYGVVATNEVDHAWMDEGLATYATARAIAEAMPDRVVVSRYFGGLLAWPYADVAWSREVHGNRLAGYRRSAGADVPSTPTWQYWPGTAGAVSYDKTAAWLATLERHLGRDVMRQALAAFYARGAFRHPEPDELFDALDEASGRDLSWFSDQVYRSAAVFDYGVSHVQRVGSADAILNTVVVRRYGDGVFPVDVRVRFSDGSETTERWDGAAIRRSFTFARDALVTEVHVDPDRVLLLDVNVTNNSWASAPRAAEAASKWSWRWLTWAGELLLTYAILA